MENVNSFLSRNNPEHIMSGNTNSVTTRVSFPSTKPVNLFLSRNNPKHICNVWKHEQCDNTCFLSPSTKPLVFSLGKHINNNRDAK